MSNSKQEFFNIWAKNYDAIWWTVFYQAIHQRMLEYVKLSDHANILDLGCGTGKLLNRLAGEYPHLTGTGVDFSQEMLRKARKNNQNHPRLIYVQGKAENLPFANDQFDAVFNTISFLHYQNPEQVLKEVNRVLKPSGYFYLADYTTNADIRKIAFSPEGIKFYSREKREEMGKNTELVCQGHYYLLNGVLLSLFQKGVK
jgi:ubiquinone/menaquinone biosynthesis C-methylase UbiE